MNAQGSALLRALELARDTQAGGATALMLGDGSVMLKFVQHNGAVRVHPDGRVDQIWRESDGLHAQLGERPYDVAT